MTKLGPVHAQFVCEVLLRKPQRRSSRLNGGAKGQLVLGGIHPLSFNSVVLLVYSTYGSILMAAAS